VICSRNSRPIILHLGRPDGFFPDRRQFGLPWLRCAAGLQFLLERMIGNCFRGGVVAGAAAEISGVNRNTTILFYQKLRELIFAGLDAETPKLMAGEIEVGESYFDAPPPRRPS
jgi:hypothetical protein